jgi:hypothetical protein
MPKPDHRSQMARAWLHIHAALGRTWKQGVQVLRVDWPVYPRRADHNTVAEGGNRRCAETCPSERACRSRWPRPTRGPRAKASAEIDVAAVTVEASPQTEPERPRAPHHAACEPPSALSGGDEGVEGVRGLQRASRQDRARHLGAARCGGRIRVLRLGAKARTGGGGRAHRSLI